MDQAHLTKLAERLVDPDQADAAAGRIDDDVRRLPPQLFDELERDRLLALDPVRLLQRRRVEQVGVTRHRSPDDRACVADQTVDQRQRGAGREALDPGDERRVDRHHHAELKAVKRGVRRPGCAGVPVRGHDHASDSELGGSRDADGGAARLERRGREDAVVLDEQSRDTELAAQLLRRRAAASCPPRSRADTRHPGPATARRTATAWRPGWPAHRRSCSRELARGRTAPTAARRRSGTGGGRHPAAAASRNVSTAARSVSMVVAWARRVPTGSATWREALTRKLAGTSRGAPGPTFAACAACGPAPRSRDTCSPRFGRSCGSAVGF